MRNYRALFQQEAGSIVLVFGLAAPVLLGGTALAVDAASVAALRGGLQGVADSAALAGAKQLHVYQADTAGMQEGIRERAQAMLVEDVARDAEASVAVGIDTKAGSVTVTVDAAPRTILLGALGYGKRVSATAVARAFGSTRLCVLALDSSGDAIQVSRAANINAAECAVQSNSVDSDAIGVDALSRIKARSICSSGGVEGASAAFSPAPQTDCPAIEDPLAGQAPAVDAPCDHKNLKILLPRTIRPGHYCGGLRLGPTALVSAAPGEYIISGGPLQLAAASALVGAGVSFRFADDNASFSFGLGSIVRLSAPTSGPMAGFLFYQDPGVKKVKEFLIATDLASELLGTIYLPNGRLKVDVLGLVAANSAYTVIVAKRIEVKGADLVINSDYGATDVPVPAGVGATAGEVALSR